MNKVTPADSHLLDRVEYSHQIPFGYLIRVNTWKIKVQTIK